MQTLVESGPDIIRVESLSQDKPMIANEIMNALSHIQISDSIQKRILRGEANSKFCSSRFFAVSFPEGLDFPPGMRPQYLWEKKKEKEKTAKDAYDPKEKHGVKLCSLASALRLCAAYRKPRKERFFIFVDSGVNVYVIIFQFQRSSGIPYIREAAVPEQFYPDERIAVELKS